MGLSFQSGPRCRQHETTDPEAEDRIRSGLTQAWYRCMSEFEAPRTTPEKGGGVPRFRLTRLAGCRTMRESRQEDSPVPACRSERGEVASFCRSSLIHVCENSLNVFVVFEFIEEFFDFTHLFFSIILRVVGNALRARFLNFDPQFLNR